MKTIVSQAGKLILIFIITFCVLLALLVGSAMIPRQNIHEHMLESAEFMVKRPVAYLVFDFARSSKIDYYADCITLSIANYLDENHPLESAMWAKYYGENSNVMNEYLLESVQNNLAPTQEYLRYWHGSAALMRILHLFWNIRTIYIFHIILVAALIGALAWLLIKNGYKGEAIAFIISMIIVAAWFVPLCLEYTYTFLCMLVTAFVGVWFAVHEKHNLIVPLFLISGMATAFFDFLTTETLPLLVPLLFICRIQNAKKTDSNLWTECLKRCIAWGIGYLGMWALKWATASIVLGIEVMPYVTDHVAERINGKVVSYPLTGNMYTDALVKNLRSLFPFEYGIYGAALVMFFVLIVIVLPVATGRVSIRSSINKSNMLLYAVLGLIPYLRYLVLCNHSFVHFFFTYRAQAASILALCFIIFELVEPRKAVMKNA